MLRQTSQVLSPKLIDQLDQCLRDHHYSAKAVEMYIYWARWYICFHGFRHPINMGAGEVQLFLAYLVKNHNVTGAAYIHALCALLFLYKKLLKIDLGWIDSEPPPSRSRKEMTALSRRQLEMPLLHTKNEPDNVSRPRATQTDSAICA